MGTATTFKKRSKLQISKVLENIQKHGDGILNIAFCANNLETLKEDKIFVMCGNISQIKEMLLAAFTYYEGVYFTGGHLRKFTREHRIKAPTFFVVLADHEDGYSEELLRLNYEEYKDFAAAGHSSTMIDVLEGFVEMPNK